MQGREVLPPPWEDQNGPSEGGEGGGAVGGVGAAGEAEVQIVTAEDFVQSPKINPRMNE